MQLNNSISNSFSPIEQGDAISLMPTVLIKIFLGKDCIGCYRALLDSGSQPNLLGHNIVKHHLAKCGYVHGNVIGIGEKSVKIKREIRAYIQPWFEEDPSSKIPVDFWVLPKSSTWAPTLPERNVGCVEVGSELKSSLADPTFWKSTKTLVLLGIAMWPKLIEGSVCNLTENLLVQDSKLGKLIMGTVGGIRCAELPLKTFSIKASRLDKLDDTMRKFWEFEDLPLGIRRDAEQEMVEKIFKDRHSRSSSGAFIVEMPLKPTINELGSSRAIALRRFFALEKKFRKDANYKEKYVEFMRDYQETRHMIRAEPLTGSDGPVYYIPHHGVVTSGKFRVVLDSSCATDAGVSLNDMQLVGAKLQKDLIEIIMRFRRWKIGINADIKQMFRQVRIAPEQWNLQRIFWRENEHEVLKEYWIVVVIYGNASSPHCAVRSMIEGALEFENKFPRAAGAIKNDFYMDDSLTGAQTIGEAITLAKEMKFILSKSGFLLCKWKSNCAELLNELEGDFVKESMILTEQTSTSILGLKWLTGSDEFTYEVKSEGKCEQLTKRIILGEIARLYDPNGFIAPVIARTKKCSCKKFGSPIWTGMSKFQRRLPTNGTEFGQRLNVWKIFEFRVG